MTDDTRLQQLLDTPLDQLALDPPGDPLLAEHALLRDALSVSDADASALASRVLDASAARPTSWLTPMRMRLAATLAVVGLAVALGLRMTGGASPNQMRKSAQGAPPMAKSMSAESIHQSGRAPERVAQADEAGPSLEGPHSLDTHSEGTHTQRTGPERTARRAQVLLDALREDPQPGRAIELAPLLRRAPDATRREARALVDAWLERLSATPPPDAERAERLIRAAWELADDAQRQLLRERARALDLPHILPR